MEKSEIQRVLSAPIVRLKEAPNKAVYVVCPDMDIDNNIGEYYTFKLGSGITFIAYISMLREYYRFFVLDSGKTKIGLKSVSWLKNAPHEEVYDTKVESDKDEASYREVLAGNCQSQTGEEACHPLLQKAIQLRKRILTFRQAQQTLLKAQKDLHALLIPCRPGPGHPLGVGNTHSCKD